MLHSAPPLLRDLVRRLLEPEFEVVEADAWHARQAQHEDAPALPTAGVHLLVAPAGARPEHAPDLARRANATTVIIVGDNGRWGARVHHGTLQRVLLDLTPDALRDLVRH
ncbi:MAG TPA: hypothetical protein VFV33_15005 [Gemmatimonadaceae bacterium]|nr:hypothetical protein [Gemmatimonadaceae bacterium]